MTKNLSQRIAERTQSNKGAATSRHKVAFIALLKDIQEALADGWSVRDIWGTLFEEQKISFSYKTFRIYVNQFALISPGTQPDIQPEMPTPEKVQTTVGKTPNFIFNPEARAEDLL